MKKIVKFVVLFLLCFVLFSCNKSDETKEVPEEYYSLIFDDYKSFVSNICSDEFEDYINNQVPVEWFEMSIDARHGIATITEKNFGYSLTDINRDGTQELIFIRDDYFVLAIYTIKDGNPYLLDAFNYKHNGMVLKDGCVFSTMNGGDNYIEYRVQTLEKEHLTLKTVCEFGMNYDLGYYLKDKDSKIKAITEEEFLSILSDYPDLEGGDIKQYLIECGIDFCPVF